MLNDLLNWDHFLTPRIIKVFYLLNLALVAVFVLMGIVSSLGFMMYSLFGGVLSLIATCIGGAIGVVAARVFAEFILTIFQMEDHLAAMRKRWEA